jgi:hypothetical protein
MARQTIQIPVEFQFEIEPATWKMASAMPMGWLWGSSEGPILEIIEPFCYRRLRVTFSRDQLPQLSGRILPFVEPYRPSASWAPVDYEKQRALWKRVRDHFGDQRIELLICGRRENSNKKRPRIDAWSLRDEFLRLKRGNVELLEFLNYWGTWREWFENTLTQYQPSVGPDPELPLSLPRFRPPILSDSATAVLIESVWSDQDAFKTALKSPDLSASLARLSFAAFEVRREFPHFVRKVATCRDAIQNTITMDILRGSRFRLCALSDCRIPFRLESGHKRTFCCQYHAHLASVRRNRKRAATG